MEEFTVLAQKLELDVDFVTRSLKGKTVITIQPKTQDLNTIRLNARQCIIKKAQIEGFPVSPKYSDPYTRIQMRPSWTVHQHQIARERLEDELKLAPLEPEDALELAMPRGVKIKQAGQTLVPRQPLILGPDAQTNGVVNGDVLDSAVPRIEMVGSYVNLDITLEFEVPSFRDGLHFVGLLDGDDRYPHVYTHNSSLAGTACSIFPCVDKASSRHEWDISIRCPRTLGDAVRKTPAPSAVASASNLPNGVTQSNGDHSMTGTDQSEYIISLTREELATEMLVVCSGDLTDDITDPNDPTHKTVSFRVNNLVAPRHIGFAIGPFEHVNLSEFRESDQDEKLGTNATRVHGFCLPGRAEEIRNTCMPLAAALDFIGIHYGVYPFANHKVCFVDDLAPNIADTASLSICSTRLLVPENILDPLDDVTRELIRGLAAQWIGISVIPREGEDEWIAIGGQHFIADHFGQELWGKNEQRFRNKMAADKIVDTDMNRPSLHELGKHVSQIPAWRDFMKLKAPLVLHILHQRLVKASGRNGVNRIYARLFQNAKTEALLDGAISTQNFLKICEKWVYGSGCPLFYITQRFNKKKLVVELTIRQSQKDSIVEQKLEPGNFHRRVKEDQLDVGGSETQPIFTGPMTIRIHEADGTPYEHIVEIKDQVTKVEIPYNTKYKRLKRSRRQKERAAAATGIDTAGDNQDDVLLYCLGDTLQSEEEVKDWRLTDWSKEDEEKMAQESYEWIRVDKDFEWIAKVMFNQPHYMYVSQLQQDNDVVAQVEAMQYLYFQAQNHPHPLISAICVRTLMDRRYFHGIRVMAADILAMNGREELDYIGLYHLEKAYQEFFCLNDSLMTRSNDFSDRVSYLIQCAIPRAMARVRDNNGKVPMRVKQFFVDKLKFNDNSNNEYSDCYYLSILMSCLGESLITKSQSGAPRYDFSFEEDEAAIAEAEFQRKAINEIERYRRIDEWIPSYQNIHSVTSMDCMQLLMQSKTIPRKGVDFMQSTRSGNADSIRVKAFDGLAQLGFMANPTVMKYIVQSFAFETSPYMRKQIWTALWLGLGHASLTKPQTQASIPEQNGGLIVEQDQSTTEQRQAELKRKETVPGALGALKIELGQDEGLADATLQALRSPSIGAEDFVELLDLCDVLYDPSEGKLVVTLQYPRYWRVEHLGGGKVRFSKTEKIRTTKMKPYAPPTKSQPAKRQGSPELKRRATEDHVKQPHPTIRITQKQKEASPAPAVVPPQPVQPVQPVQPPAPSVKLKLKLGKKE
ncbi:hypothetical protein NA57DRAFT_65578 [Rhizodiscina lignyota]|uniref:Transcription initiation factor TFIID subunit 2 n=1 Tax=Rhizodiscina lignyota TaxID=1504668 RepID=A0A9P4IHU3_9PEZI|nr:hypothetical protein NA57DRAFT_65578 [Rhizodiscina lignyota]